MIVRDANLYGKRSCHWSKADPISVLVWIAMTCVALSLGGVYLCNEWLIKTTIQNEELSVYDVVSTIFTILRSVQICLMFHRASQPTALSVVPALCNISSTHAMEILKYNIIHYQVAWINHWLSKLGGLLYAPPVSVADIFIAVQLLSRRKVLSITSTKAGSGLIVGSVLSEICVTNNQTERREEKRGRKSSNDKREHNNMAKWC